MCPSENEIFDSILENAVELDEAQTRRGYGRRLAGIILFIPRLLWRWVSVPFRRWQVRRAKRRSQV
jgi:hypothetical protein